MLDHRSATAGSPASLARPSWPQRSGATALLPLRRVRQAPSPESYALAVQVFDQMRARLAAAGLGAPEHFDMWTALVAGLSAQQTANDPGGDRWLRLIDEAVDMYADHVMPRHQREAKR